MSCVGHGGLVVHVARHDAEAVRYMDEALRLARGLSDARTLCYVLTKFAHLHHRLNESDSALRLASEGLAVGRPWEKASSWGTPSSCGRASMRAPKSTRRRVASTMRHWRCAGA